MFLHWGDVLSGLDARPRPQRCLTLRCFLHLSSPLEGMSEPTFSMCMVCQQLLAYHFQMASGQKTDRGALRHCPGCWHALHATAPMLHAAAICKTKLSCLGQTTMCSTREYNTDVLQTASTEKILHRQGTLEVSACMTAQ